MASITQRFFSQTRSPGARRVTGVRDKLLRHVHGHGWRNHTLFQTKMVEIDTLVFQTKTAKKHTVPFGAEQTYIAYIRE